MNTIAAIAGIFLCALFGAMSAISLKNDDEKNE